MAWLGLVGQFGVYEFLVLFILTRIYSRLWWPIFSHFVYEPEFVIWAPWLGLIGQFGVHEILVLFILTHIYSCLWWPIFLHFGYGSYSKWKKFGMTIINIFESKLPNVFYKSCHSRIDFLRKCSAFYTVSFSSERFFEGTR